MNDDFESWIELFSNDGASTPMPGFPDRLGGDADDVFNEWCRERGFSTEYDLLLGSAEELLRDVLCEGKLTGSSIKKMRLLYRVIRERPRSDAPG